jgi:hypothetical protein
METPVTQKHIDKLELKVEKIDDKVDKLKEDIFELKGDIKVYANDVRKHVAGDEKIISEVIPVIRSINDILPELKAITLYHQARKIQEQQDIIKKKKLKTNLTIAGAIVGIVTAVVGVFFRP